MSSSIKLAKLAPGGIEQGDPLGALEAQGDDEAPVLEQHEGARARAATEEGEVELEPPEDLHAARPGLEHR